MTTTLRLPSGGRIDRGRLLDFRFNGRKLQGHPGDTLASALLASGEWLIGRSFKYHRPRGLYSAGVEEPNALVQLETGAYTEPDVPATIVELYDDLEAASVNVWPSARFDVGALNQRFAPLLPAGFYYKTFMWPAKLWMTYERVIRRAAGLGRAPSAPDPDTYDKMHVHCDVLVVGAGPAGLAAALEAGATGARVIVADQQPAFGGRLLDERDTIADVPAASWIGEVVSALEATAEVRLLPRTTVFGYYDHNYLALLERRHPGRPGSGSGPRERLWKVRAKQVVLATGAIERPLVFADNDRPGVMLAGAVRAYANRYGVAAGRRLVVFTNNDDAYRTAFDLADAGVAVAAVVDVRKEVPAPLVARCRTQDLELITGAAVVAALGRSRVTGAQVMALDDAGSAVTGQGRRIDCDAIAVSGGWNPAVHLFSQSGGKLRFDDTAACFVPDTSTQAERSVGAAAGTFDLAGCLDQGLAAGRAAAEACGFAVTMRRSPPPVEGGPASPSRPLWVVPAAVADDRRAYAKHFIDLHNDVTVADVSLAAREGYVAIEHTKRYTTLGMGTDQGKTGNVHGLAVLAGIRGESIPDVGTTTFRPPYTPVTFGAFAGREVGALYDPARLTPMHPWHVQAGAAFEDVGQWKRPWYYPKHGETMRAAVGRECLAVRNAVGILDATTLGKIDLQGPDVSALLNRLYTNAWSKLAVGRCRYGVMCKDDGMVFDDGVTARLGEHRYLMTTTSGNAALVLAWIEEWLQTEWPDLRVYATSVTENWATASIAGPFARRLLAELTDLDLSAAAFPHMSVKEARVAGLPARIFRISFTGEPSFEINVPARYGLALWTALIQAGEAYGITPYGTETMHVLRAEKGYIIAGQDTDGTVTPADLGMDWIISKTKDFIGKRSLRRADTARADRKQLVGLLSEDPSLVLPEGAQLVSEVRDKPPMAMIGHVTSSYHSPNVGRSIALALVKGGQGRMGERVYLPLAGHTAEAVIASPVFFDPEGTRLHG